ncbi:PREDICTED: B3 domain-containing protein Os01g0234100-like isoform X1 [Ipomoea nil]|uniref:B3 domain-containing protein Os01g0234100-like isoform X1 n=1 Tax=Ipomoea nil TaxID=35883 RepID=UPI0009015EAD|nr:PREDICTED: B3 domain-containing protein Os01g0234100-like isoform X1 [Ipomoea nil]
MAGVSVVPTMASEPVSMIEHNSEEPLIKQVKPEKNLEQEEGIDDQLTLSQYFMNKSSSSVSPSMGTPLVGEASATTNRKRARVMIKDRCKKSATHSSPTMQKAKAFQASLDPTQPSFIKLLSRSHVTHGFWLGLPADFCRMYLPPHDHTIPLEGDNEKQYEAKFIAERQGLSGGWRGFSLAHNLQEGDAAVFHLVQQYKFKVYTVRAVHERSYLEENCQNDGQPETNYELGDEGFIFENDKEDSPAETKDGSSTGSFVDLKKFSIVVNECPMDSKFSISARQKYYELCCAQKSYLHDGFAENINYTLAVGIILETVSIADNIKACTLSTPLTDFKSWDNTLSGFMHLGMDVGFLQERLSKLSTRAIEFQGSHEASRHCEIITEENNLNKEIESVERKLMELKEALMDVQVEKEALETQFLIYDMVFCGMAKSPW